MSIGGKRGRARKEYFDVKLFEENSVLVCGQTGTWIFHIANL